MSSESTSSPIPAPSALLAIQRAAGDSYAEIDFMAFVWNAVRFLRSRYQNGKTVTMPVDETPYPIIEQALVFFRASGWNARLRLATISGASHVIEFGPA